MNPTDIYGRNGPSRSNDCHDKIIWDCDGLKRHCSGQGIASSKWNASRQWQPVSKMHRKVRCHTSLIPRPRDRENGLDLFTFRANVQPDALTGWELIVIFTYKYTMQAGAHRHRTFTAAYKYAKYTQVSSRQSSKTEGRVQLYYNAETARSVSGRDRNTIIYNYTSINRCIYKTSYGGGSVV